TVQPAAASVHREPDLRRAAPGDLAHSPPHRARRRGAERAEPAVGVLLPHALPRGDAALRDGDAGAGRGEPRTPRRVPFPRIGAGGLITPSPPLKGLRRNKR